MFPSQSGAFESLFFLPSNRKEKLQIHNPRGLLLSYVSSSCLRLIIQHSRPNWNGKSQIESLLRETFRPPRSSHAEEAAVIAAHMKRSADLSRPPSEEPLSQRRGVRCSYINEITLTPRTLRVSGTSVAPRCLGELISVVIGCFSSHLWSFFLEIKKK